jgi:hypothetical protein
MNCLFLSNPKELCNSGRICCLTLSIQPLQDSSQSPHSSFAEATYEPIGMANRNNHRFSVENKLQKKGTHLTTHPLLS